ncbi:MAG: carboxypeptidase regulatory-like domain-containing protein [Candidatus Parabeggiatoa sp. nov. 1]|nr:MAG: carboxypeptidase regulatory-like domain-containing protein [Gammaproteobacteria bacterium]HEC83962.1 carboxypeptidase regulatory-like domain-containing protein [Thioploca sp.]
MIPIFHQLTKKSLLALAIVIVLIVGKSYAVPDTITADDMEEFTILPLGIMIGRRNVIPSTLVRGLEDGEQAVNFEQWLLPFDAVTKALQISVTNLEDGQMELRSPGLITRISPEQLKTDPELGQALTIKDIETLFHVPAKFDIEEYAIVLAPPWLNTKNKKGHREEPLPVLLDGLPAVHPDRFNFTALGQQISINGDKNNTNTQGNLFAIGKLGKGSWYLRTHQQDLFDTASWQLGDAQYFRQTETMDYALGSQSTFWQSQTGGDYWGATLVKRNGFSSLQSSQGGFDPALRRQGWQVARTITGEAAPGTLVQLVEGFGDQIIAETLVDSSGVYRFEDVASRTQSFQEYRILLYPNGVLTATPEERKAQFDTRAGQLEVGASAWIFSGGVNRQFSTGASLGATGDQYSGQFWGEAEEFRGGFSYRRGVFDSLTLGGGLVHEDSLKKPMAEMYYQPAKLPFGLSFSALMEENNKIRHNANASLRLFNKLNLNFSSDPLSERFYLNWNLLPGFSLRARSDSRTHLKSGGFTYSKSINKFFASLSAEMDTEEQMRGYFTGYWDKWHLNYQKDDMNDAAKLSYNLSGNPRSDLGHSLVLTHKSSKIGNRTNELKGIAWHYESPAKARDGRNLWRVDLGYANGTHGNGFIGTLTTTIIPGVDIRLRYQDISIVSNETSFLLEFSTNFRLQPKRDWGNRYIEQLRGQGGIFVQPFLDKNDNGVHDDGEEVYTEHADLLLLLNNKSVSKYRLRVTKQGIYTQVTPGTYRLDLDPAGYPIGGTPEKESYAVQVTAGGYTSVIVPFSVSYTIAGTVQDAEGNPVGGVKVEAVPVGKGSKSFAVTNGAGIFFVDNVRQGVYKMLLDGQSVNADTIEITPDSELIVEVNLKKP